MCQKRKLDFFSIFFNFGADHKGDGRISKVSIIGVHEVKFPENQQKYYVWGERRRLLKLDDGNLEIYIIYYAFYIFILKKLRIFFKKLNLALPGVSK